MVNVLVVLPSIVWLDVVFTVMVADPVFLTTYILPEIPTEVGNVTENGVFEDPSIR